MFLQCDSVGVGDALELFLGQFVALNDVLVALQPREGARFARERPLEVTVRTLGVEMALHAVNVVAHKGEKDVLKGGRKI